MLNYMSDLTWKNKRELESLGAIVDENPLEKSFVRLRFNDQTMTLSHNDNLWYLGYKGETIASPEDELALAVRFLLNYTVKYQVVSDAINK